MDWNVFCPAHPTDLIEAETRGICRTNQHFKLITHFAPVPAYHLSIVHPGGPWLLQVVTHTPDDLCETWLIKPVQPAYNSLWVARSRSDANMLEMGQDRYSVLQLHSSIHSETTDALCIHKHTTSMKYLSNLIHSDLTVGLDHRRQPFSRVHQWAVSSGKQTIRSTGMFPSVFWFLNKHSILQLSLTKTQQVGNKLTPSLFFCEDVFQTAADTPPFLQHLLV